MAWVCVPAGHPRPEQQPSPLSWHLERDVRDSQLPANSRQASAVSSAGPAGPRQRKFRSIGQRPDELSFGQFERKAAGDHRLRHCQLSSFARRAGLATSVFGRYSSLFYTPGRRARGKISVIFCITAFRKRPTSAMSLWNADEGAYHPGRPYHPLWRDYQADDLISQTASLVLPTASGSARDRAAQSKSAMHRPTHDLPNVGCSAQYSPITGPSMPGLLSVYVQDEWKIVPGLHGELRPPLRSVWRLQPGRPDKPANQHGVDALDGTALHIGYSRYFSPPPIELVGSSDIRSSTTLRRRRQSRPDTTPQPNAPTIMTRAFPSRSPAAKGRYQFILQTVERHDR